MALERGTTNNVSPGRLHSSVDKNKNHVTQAVSRCSVPPGRHIDADSLMPTSQAEGVRHDNEMRLIGEAPGQIWPEICLIFICQMNTVPHSHIRAPTDGFTYRRSRMKYMQYT